MATDDAEERRIALLEKELIAVRMKLEKEANSDSASEVWLVVFFRPTAAMVHCVCSQESPPEDKVSGTADIGAKLNLLRQLERANEQVSSSKRCSSHEHAGSEASLSWIRHPHNPPY